MSKLNPCNKLPSHENLVEYVLDNLTSSNTRGSVSADQYWNKYIADYVCYEFKIVAPTKRELQIITKRFMKALKPIWFYRY